MALSVIDLAVFMSYMAGIVLFGSLFFFQNRDSAAYTTGGGKIPAWAVGMSIIGTSLFAYYQALPGLLPADLHDISSGDRVFPYFIVHELPAGITGLLIASVFAAGMSTISTSVNGTATIILFDYVQRYIKPDISEKGAMRVLYFASLIFGIMGIAIALAMLQVKSALDAWWMPASIFSGGMLGLFLLGVISRTAGSFDALAGGVVGVLVIVWLSPSPLMFTQGLWVKFRSPFHAHFTIVIGTTVIFLVGFLSASRTWRQGSDPGGLSLQSRDRS